MMFKFRPSSHSTSYTLVLYYPSEDEVKEAEVRFKKWLAENSLLLDRMGAEDIKLGRSEHNIALHLHVYVEVDWDVLERLRKRVLREERKHVKPVEAEWFKGTYYIIKLKVPRGVGRGTLALILGGRSVEAADKLDSIYGGHRVEQCGEYEVWVWEGVSDIYFSPDDRTLTFPYCDEEYELGEEWEVQSGRNIECEIYQKR